MVWFLADARCFCLLQTFQTSYEVQPASQPMGTAGSFPGAYSGQVLKPSSARIKNGWCDTSAPSYAFVVCTATTFNCSFLLKLPATATYSTFSFKRIDCPTDEQWNQDNSNSIVTRLRAGWLKKRGLISGTGSPEWPSWPTHFSIQWVLESLSPKIKRLATMWSWMLTAQLVPRSGMNGAVPLFPPIPSWYEQGQLDIYHYL